MQTSETISELITALAAAQGEFKAVPKSATNPHLNNKYATLDGVIATIRGPLSKNGIAFVQPLTNVEGTFWLETRLMHSSGEWIASATPIPELAGNRAVNALQMLGGALTYMRRYMLTSMLGINAEEDSDGGNGAKPKPAAKRKATRQPAKPKPAAKPKAKATTPAASKSKSISLSGAAMTALIDGNLADGPQNAAAMVNLSTVLSNDSTVEETVAWSKNYRAARDGGAGTAKAAKQADAQASLEANAEGGDEA